MDSTCGLLAPVHDDSCNTLLADNLNPLRTRILASDSFYFPIRLPGALNSRQMHFLIETAQQTHEYTEKLLTSTCLK